MRVAVLTVSDRASSGDYRDETGPAVAAIMTDREATVVARRTVSDDIADISSALRSWCDDDVADLVLTNGGTGLSPRDVTPEATLSVVERQVPGLAEAMRSAGRENTALADLSRQVVGQRARTLIVNLPGSPKGATESLLAIVGTLPHAIELMRMPP